MAAVHETTSARRIAPGLAQRPRASILAPLLALAVGACASGRSESSGTAPPAGAVPAFVRTDGPCWVGGRITLDPSLRAQSTADELANLGCDNVVLVMKTDDGNTKLVHADGVLAGGWGECRQGCVPLHPRLPLRADLEGGVQRREVRRLAGLAEPAARLRSHGGGRAGSLTGAFRSAQGVSQ